MRFQFLRRMFGARTSAYAGPALGVVARRDAPRPVVVFPTGLRPQHLGVIGLSGSGKTYFFEHLIRQDIGRGVGFVLFDVHGDLADSVVSFMAEKATADQEVLSRAVILEPFDEARTFGFNPLEAREGVPAHLAAQEFAHILRARWNDETFGPRTEELLRNSLWTLALSRRTLLDFPLLLSNRRFRERLSRDLPDVACRAYWETRYDSLSAKMQAVVREPILTRMSGFLEDPLVRDIVGQRQSTFSFLEAARQGQFVVVNLAKGRLGANSAILGSMLFAKLELDVMSLARLPREERKLFVVYADELQNLASSTFNRLVAEARKYKISLVAGHQFWKQLDPALREAMLGVGTKVFFRLHYHDALELAGELAPEERQRYIRILTSLEAGEAVIRLGAGRPVLVSVPAHRPANPSQAEVEALREASATRSTRPREVVRREISPDLPDVFVDLRGNEPTID